MRLDVPEPKTERGGEKSGEQRNKTGRKSQPLPRLPPVTARSGLQQIQFLSFKAWATSKQMLQSVGPGRNSNTRQTWQACKRSTAPLEMG